MEKITKVTEADIGRIAVDEESLYRVKILGLSGEEEGYVSVEYLPGSNYDEGRLVGKISSSFNLAIAGFGRTMYWENSVEELSKANTPFTRWCAENGYEDFNGACSDVVLKPKEKQKRVAKPRFRKPRQKPPVRKKTDVILEYVDGTLYHLKNVKFIGIKQDTTQFNFEKIICNGIRENSFINIDIKLIKHISVVSPKGDLEIYLPEMWIINKDFTAQFTAYTMSF